MSIIYQGENCVILDHELWMLKRYSTKGDDSSANDKKKIFQILFDLRTPFLMDGEAQKLGKQLESGSPVEPRKKKRKKGVNTPSPEESFQENHVQEVLAALRITPEFKAKFCYVPSSEDYHKNNALLRETRMRFMEASNYALPVLNESHEGPSHTVRVIDDQKYLLPPNVSYICDDVQNILSHTSGEEYDLVVVDPPWLNKHVRRQTAARGIHHGYDMMGATDTLSIPLGDILSEDALVAVWCTNSKNEKNTFVKDLHKKWGIHLVATWYWLKVTRAGEPVSKFGVSHGKRPYELVLIASKQERPSATIPDGLVICSVPSGLHSHKPPLDELLRKYVAPNPKCLELFCRSPVPGWLSYGMEVLRLNHSFLFEEHVL